MFSQTNRFLPLLPLDGFLHQQPQYQTLNASLEINSFLPLLPLVSHSNQKQPPCPKRTGTSTTLSSINTTSPPSLTSSTTSSPTTSPSPLPITLAYAIRKRTSPSIHPNLEPATLGIYPTLDQANNTVYSLRLAYETCDPCFFWYSDGRGLPHPELSNPPQTPTTKGEFLSWEVFPDEDEKDYEGTEKGCRVWVERVELNAWNIIELSLAEMKGDLRADAKTRVCNWREALEPIARPCDFWGTFTVK